MKWLIFALFLCLMLVVSVPGAVADTVAVSSEGDIEEVRAALDNMSLATLVNILEEYGMHLGDNYYSKEELISLILEIIDTTNEKSQKQQKSKQMNRQEDLRQEEAVSLQVPTSPGSSVWQLFKEQVQADFAPFIMLVPQPIKAFVAIQFPRMLKALKITARGAIVPMTFVAGKAFRHGGNLLLLAADQLERLSKSIDADMEMETPAESLGARRKAHRL